MADMNASRRIFALIAQCEQTISQVYARYAARFPEDAEFWDGLARDEARHGVWALDLQSKVDSGLLLVTPRHDNVAVYEEYADFLRAQLAEANAPTLSPLQAFATAHLIEKSYIERHLLEVADTDSPELLRVLTMLSRDTERHRDSLEARRPRR